jgi:hypothetical protein
MHIDSYRFGRIVVDGETYSGDCLIFRDHIEPNWWRREGHKLNLDDLEAVLSAKPELLVVGCGAYGVMQVTEEVYEVLRQKKIQLETLKTAQAAELFNELSAAGRNIVAAMHLTC